jgi:hypothetical protein
MFRSFTWLSTFLVAVFSLLWIIQVSIVRSGDLARYEQYKKEQELLSEKPLFSTATQNRKQVRKDIWFTQENQTRLQHRIDSESSILTLQPSKGRSFEVIEQLFHIRCLMQEKVYATSAQAFMQQVRFMEADEGIYRYQIQNFTANQVSLSLFRLPGFLLPADVSQSHPFLKGNAQDITFSISGSVPQFQAQNFKATLRQSGGI